MRVKVTLSVEVDPALWNQEYRDDSSASDIRRMVKSDAEQAVSDTFAHLPFVTVTSRP